MPNDKVTITVEVDGRQVTVSLNNLSEAFKKLGSTISSAAQPATTQLTQLNSSVAHIGDTLTSTIVKANLFTQAFTMAASAVKGLLVDTTLYAARTQVLGTVLDSVAKANNLNTIAVRDQVEVMKSLGITTQEARQSVTRMIQAQLDVAKATQLARVAQDAAVIAGVNSSEALQRILHGITTFQPEILRTMGIIISSQEAFEKFARANNTTADALTATQKQAAFMNAVIERGSTIAGSYEAAMGDVGKQLTSLKRFQEEAANAIGQQFLPILGMGVQVLTEFFKIVAAHPEAITAMTASIGALGVSFLALNTAVFTSAGVFARWGVASVAAIRGVGTAMLFLNGVTLAGVAGWVGVGLAVAATVAAFVDFSDASERALKITADQREKNLGNIKTLQAQLAEMQRIEAAYRNNENVTESLNAVQSKLDVTTRALVGSHDQLGEEINATTAALKERLAVENQIAALSFQAKILGLVDSYDKMTDSLKRASQAAKALRENQVPTGAEAFARGIAAIVSGGIGPTRQRVEEGLIASTEAAKKSSDAMKQLASDVLAYGKAHRMSNEDIIAWARQLGVTEPKLQALREAMAAVNAELQTMNRTPFDLGKAVSESMSAVSTALEQAGRFKDAGAFLPRQQRNLLKELGIPTQQEARQQFGIVMHDIQEAAAATGKTVAEIFKEQPEALNKLLTIFTKQAQESKSAADAAKKHAEAIRQLEEAIRKLGQPKLTGLAAEIANLEEQFRRIQQQNPSEEQLKLARATLESAKAAAVLNDQLERENALFKSIQEGVSKRVGEALKESEETNQEGVKRTQILKDAQHAATLSNLATEAERSKEEHERRKAQGEQELIRLKAKHEEITAFKKNLDDEYYTNLQRQEQERLRGLQQEVELLRVRVGAGAATSDVAREQSEALQMQVRHQHELNNARATGLGTQEESLIMERQQLELIDLQQEQYRRLYDDLEEQAGRVFDAITAKGKSGFQGLVDYIQGLWLTAMRKMFAEAVASLLTPMFSRLREIFALGGGTQSGGLGGLTTGVGGLPSLIASGGGFGIPGLGSARTPPFVPLGSATAAQLPATLGMAGIPGVASAAIPGLAGVGELSLPATFASPLTTAGSALGATAGAGGGFAATHGLFGASFKQIGAFFSSGTGAALAGGGLGLAGGALLGRALGIGGGRSALAGALGAGSGLLAAALGAGALAGPIGLAAGLAAAGLIRLIGGQSREAKFQKEIMRDFGIGIQDKAILQQIKDIGESTFGHDADSKRFETLRLDSVQGLLLDYAVRTGQNPAQLPLYQRFYGRGIPAPPVSLNVATGALQGLNLGNSVGVNNVTGGSQSNSFNISIDARGSRNPEAIGREVATVLEQKLRQNYRRQRIADTLFGLNPAS